MKSQRNLHEPRQYFSNSLCLFCRAWSSFRECFCPSRKQVYLNGVIYLLVYSRIVFHPSISCLGLNERDEYTGISLILIKAFKVQVLQGVLEPRNQPRHLGGCQFHTSSPGLESCIIVAVLWATPFPGKPINFPVKNVFLFLLFFFLWFSLCAPRSTPDCMQKYWSFAGLPHLVLPGDSVALPQGVTYS